MEEDFCCIGTPSPVPPWFFLMGPTYLGLIHHGSHGAVPGGEDPPPVEEGPAAGLEEPRLVALVRLDALEKKHLHRFSGLTRNNPHLVQGGEKASLVHEFQSPCGKERYSRCEHKDPYESV